MDNCRFCGESLKHTLVNLGLSPLCESFRTKDEIHLMEEFFPLHTYICHNCYLVQLQEFVSPEKIFREYAYFSSYADSWVEHARKYTEDVTERFGLTKNSFVVELASNDGYLLQHFVNKDIPALGIEPAENVAKVAIEKGVDTLTEFFGVKLARELVSQGKTADLIVGNNVLAQVPDINDFVEGIKILLKPQGIITIEFPHLMKLIEGNQFDTIYHEHFSYFSFITARKIFEVHGLFLFDVEELPTHGGSLRIFGRHKQNASLAETQRAREMIDRETRMGYTTMEHYMGFAEQVKQTKRNILKFLIEAKENKKTIAGYGAPGKGNTLLVYCGIGTDFIDYTVDRNPYKHGKYLPGSHIPIFPPDRIRETKPDYVFILPWNFRDEIMQQMADIKEWGGRFVVPIPEVKVF